VFKLSPGKATLPGSKQVYRRQAPDGTFLEDVIASANEPPLPDARPLLELVMRGGKSLRAHPTLTESRGRFQREFAALPERHKVLKSPTPYPSEITHDLERMADKVAAEVKRHERP
jgi:nicotinate phosphoribosyltransferase